MISFPESTEEVQEPDKKQPEDPTGVRDYFKEAPISGSPNAARIDMPVFKRDPTNEAKISAEPKNDKFKLNFEEQVQTAKKRLIADSDNWVKTQEAIRLMMPENDWRGIPGFPDYEMNRLGVIRGGASKLERPTYVKLWCGGDNEVVIGVDAIKAMTFGKPHG